MTPGGPVSPALARAAVPPLRGIVPPDGAGFIDPCAELCRLADVVATIPGLVVHDGHLSWLHEGVLNGVSMNLLGELITKNIETQRLVQRDDRWELVYSPLKLDPKTLRTLFMADSYKTGSLIARVMTA